MPLIDSYNRIIDYLRVSVTDRCNFRCVYCMPEEGAPVAPKADILTFEEMERLLGIATRLGVRKIRLTGGEPLVRRDIDQLIARIGRLPGLEDLSMTTNGYLLDRYAEDFARNGLKRVNISLDTLRPERFARIARRGDLQTVWTGLEAAEHAGLTPLKLNCVVMRGWNEDEAADFARLTRTHDWHVRFIELMPINWSQGDDSAPAIQSDMNRFFALSAEPGYRRDTNVTLYALPDAPTFASVQQPAPDTQTGQLNAAEMARAFVSSRETQNAIEAELGPLLPADVRTNGPARTFRLPNGKGTIGFISQITSDMCASCNRLRLTADGQLRPCLMADGEIDLRAALRDGSDDSVIADLFRLTVRHKPKEHRLEDGIAPVGRNMSQLGG